MTGWAEFALAFAAFYVSHRLPLRPKTRARLVARLGERGFLFAYSALSLAVLAWLIVAAGRAPHVTLWFRYPWQTWVPLVAMGVVCLLLAFGVGRANPFSFGGARNDSFDPARPGVTRWIRHPLLLALALWSGAHMVPNGDLAHVILFGSFAGFALLGMWIVDRRRQRQLGADRWSGLSRAVGKGPVLPRPETWSGAVARLASAAILYGGLLVLHPIVFGVSPLP